MSKKEELGLDNFLSHETRICTLEAAIINIDKNITEIKQEIKDIKKEYKHYFWGLVGSAGTILALIQWIIPFFKTLSVIKS